MNNDHGDARLIQFLMGVLEPSEEAATAAELRDSAELRERLAALSQDLDRVRAGLDESPDRGRRRSLLDTASGDLEAFVPRVAVFLDLDEERTRTILQMATAPADQWSEASSPGVWTHAVQAGPRHGDAGVFLLRIDTGAEIATHRHLGEEWGFILSGQLADDADQPKSAGDMVYMPPGSVHRVWNPGTHPAIVINVAQNGYDWNP